MCLGKILILADLALIKINKIKNRQIQNRFLETDCNHVLKYTCAYMRINALLLVSVCNEQILALVLEERSPLKSNAWFIMTASPARLNFVIFLSSSIPAICCSFHIRPSEFGPGTSHVWKLQISVRNIHLSTLGAICHDDGIWGNGTVFESNSTKLNMAEKNGIRTVRCHLERSSTLI